MQLQNTVFRKTLVTLEEEVDMKFKQSRAI